MAYIFNASTNGYYLYVFQLVRKEEMRDERKCKSTIAMWGKVSLVSLRDGRLTLKKKSRVVKKRADAEAAPAFQLLYQYD